MQPDAARRLGLVKKITAHGFLDVLAHGFPGVALREDVLRQAFGAITAVLFLRHFKHQFFHGVKLRWFFSDRKRGLAGVPASDAGDENGSNWRRSRRARRHFP